MGCDPARGLAPGLLALALLAVPLAGCTDGGQQADPPAAGEAYGAREGLDAADDVAEAWSSGAQLSGITMIEQGSEPDRWPSAAFDYTPDEDVGDGLVSQWLYFYLDGEDQLAVYVNAEGQIHEDTDPPGQTPQQPVGDWEFDSEDAAEEARKNASFDGIRKAGDASVLYALQERRDGPVWLLRAESEAMGEEQTVVVHAQTGEMRTPQ